MLIGRVTRLYYEHGLTHQEIADAFGISRIRVTRLLAEARERGLVEIRVKADDSPFADHEARLVAEFGLRQAWVAPKVADVEKSDAALGFVGSDALRSLIDKNCTVGVGLSTQVALVVNAFAPCALGGTYVPVSGSPSGQSDGSSPMEIALQLAARTDGRAFNLPAPLLASSKEAAELAASDPGVRTALERAEQAHIVITGVGSVTDDAGLLFNSLDSAKRAELVELGAVGDVAGRFFDAAGDPVTGELDATVVGLTLESLRRITRRVAVVRGEHKVEALRVALRSGIVNMLITDVETASALLDG